MNKKMTWARRASDDRNEVLQSYPDAKAVVTKAGTLRYYTVMATGRHLCNPKLTPSIAWMSAASNVRRA